MTRDDETKRGDGGFTLRTYLCSLVRRYYVRIIYTECAARRCRNVSTTKFNIPRESGTYVGIPVQRECTLADIMWKKCEKGVGEPFAFFFFFRPHRR